MTNQTAFARRDMMKLSAIGASIGLAGALALPAAADAAPPGGEYIMLASVTQVPFWVDHKHGLADVAKALHVKTSFTGPLNDDPTAQARQLDELIARRPSGLLIFPSSAAALTPGINRADAAGIPVAMIIGDAPDSKRKTFLGISNFDAGVTAAKLLADAIGGKGKVILGTFPAAGVVDRVAGYKAGLKKFPGIEVVDVVNDRADPSYAPTAYSQALIAHPDVVGIGGTDGDSGKGAAIAVTSLGKVGKVKIICWDRNDDMLPYIGNGTITGSVAQKSYLEAYLGVYLLYWLNASTLKVVPDWKAANINPLPERVIDGVMHVTRENWKQFRHTKFELTHF